MMDKQNWISIEDRLPALQDGWVLCFCPMLMMVSSQRVSTFEVLRWEKSYWVDIYNHCLGREFVSHWMPLPAPPEEES